MDFHFNGQGIGGLTYRPCLGWPRKLDPAQAILEILLVVENPTSTSQPDWAHRAPAADHQPSPDPTKTNFAISAP